MVALSTVEAEYIAMSRCTQQMIWMQTWLNEMEIAHTMPGVIRGDSQGVIALKKTTKDHGKVKHIDIHHHYLRELVKSDSIIFEQIASPTFSPSCLPVITTIISWLHSIFAKGLTFMGECWKVTVIPFPISSIPLFLSLPLSISYHTYIISQYPFMDITFPFMMSCDSFACAITLFMTRWYQTTLSCYPTNWEWVPIPISINSYLFITIVYPYNRLELLITVVTPLTGIYPYNTIV